MKTITFNKLEIQNFKGIRNLKINFDEDTKIKGKNGVGKTTVADSINWVLFGKDSQGRTKFNLRPQDEHGNEIDKIEVEVKLTLSNENGETVIGRKQVQKWVVRRGSNEEVFEGNENILTINESVVKTKEFETELNNILNEDDFKLLSNPMHFMNIIDDKKRREVLMELAGNENEIEEELKSRAEFINLVSEWNTDLNKNKSFSQFLTFLKDKSKTDTKKLEEIPAQIHALESTLNEDIDLNMINSLIDGYKAQIEELDSNKVDNSIPKWYEEMLQKQRELTSEKSGLEHQDFVINSNASHELSKRKLSIKKLISSDKESIERIEDEKDNKLHLIANLKKQREELLNEYHEKAKEEFEGIDIERTCSHCGQELKDLNEEELINHAKEEFENEKKSVLNDIIEKGKTIAKKLEDEEKLFESLQLEIKSLRNNIERNELSLNNIPLEADKVTNPRIKDIENELVEVKNKLASYVHKPQEDLNKEKRNQLEALLSKAYQEKGMIEQQQKNIDKINELKEIEKTLRKNKIHFEVLINDALDFEKEKNRSFEVNLESHFNNIKWRLFERQNNGGYRNVCYPLLNGTPYLDQSTGEKIFTGVDIIKTFQTVKGIEVPVIIDNKESLTIDLGLTTQKISMYVDEQLNELTII